ncbi:hypothetical protein ACVIQY_007324 [Bradyrhizobium sp. USDA 3051]
MPERVVDALELVDVDVVHRELFAAGDEIEFLTQMLVEHGAVGQVGQCVVMSEMGDALLDTPALRDVLMRRHPAAIRERFVHDLDRATVGGLDHHGIAHVDVAQDPCDILVRIAGERAGGFAVCNDVVKAAAGSHDFGRQPVHLDVALIADHELLRGVEQQQALGHVVDGAVETLLFQRQPFPRKTMLLQELANDRDQHARDGERGRGRDRDQDADLLAPVRQGRRARRGGHHQDREVRQGM